MSRTGKVSRKFEFLDVFGTAEKSKGVTEKNKEKVKANCTGFSAEFFGSQSEEMFCFDRKTKILMLTTSFQSLTRIHQRLLKSLGLYLVMQISQMNFEIREVFKVRNGLLLP